MITEHSAKDPVSYSNSLFRHERRRVGRYEWANEYVDLRLREALAREEALVRQNDKLIQQQKVFSKLFASQESAAHRVANLTPRERQIMELVVAGDPSKNIAADLGISQRTVENHRASIMKKTGSKCIAALARFALAATWNGADEPVGEQPGGNLRGGPGCIVSRYSAP